MIDNKIMNNYTLLCDFDLEFLDAVKYSYQLEKKFRPINTTVHIKAETGNKEVLYGKLLNFSAGFYICKEVINGFSVISSQSAVMHHDHALVEYHQSEWLNMIQPSIDYMTIRHFQLILKSSGILFNVLAEEIEIQDLQQGENR